MKYKKVAVHDGKFHTDDVFAVAILKLINPDLEVIRTRDPEELRKVDARIDVGGKYSLESGDFDHHQKEGAGKRDNEIPYASAGLIWENFGMELCENEEEVWKDIDERIIQPIDIEDNGFMNRNCGGYVPYTLGDVIDTFGPYWPKGLSGNENNFFEAVEFSKKLLAWEIDRVKNRVRAKEIVREKIKSSNGEYLFLGEYVPWKEVVMGETDIKYVVYTGVDSTDWCVRAVEKEEGSYESRKPLPESWRGLRDEELVKVTGVEGAVFCHSGGFIAVVKTKEGAIRLAELALKE